MKMWNGYGPERSANLVMIGKFQDASTTKEVKDVIKKLTVAIMNSEFEMLCRSLIRFHFGRFEQFAALANQPGIEFHLQLQSTCSLGELGQWFGWQCRWYDLPSGRALGRTRRDKTKAALAKTKTVLPKLTDWVRWTRHPITKGGQNWDYGLKSAMKLQMQLHLNHSTDAET